MAGLSGGSVFMLGTTIQGLIALNVTDYYGHNWHGTLLTSAVICFSIVFNTVLTIRLPLIEGTVLILHLDGFFAINIPLWVMVHVLISTMSYSTSATMVVRQPRKLRLW